METIWVRLAMAATGALSIYLGYRLFCDVSQQNRRVTSLVAGALLAILGMGILFTEARGIRAAGHARYEWNRTRPAEQGSFATPGLHHETRVVQRRA